MDSTDSLLAALVGREVVIDTGPPYVILGTLAGFDAHHVTLDHVDVHDLRDTTTTRENYMVDSRRHGIRGNRRHAIVARREIVCVAALDDVLL
ncbi:MAG: hypothetical protein EHM42_05175 [Planctomycetaceae bacterium]|nr:MAG: hypothetical protein EHM42_05175 [Planctomycetaceae bacterium]